ncbi:hypothetical protein BGW38_006726 [Lunasporangiospora selenospora]|uniref:BZIP domain-containing protein n=1 Tax=Lunasporangiospora selenospora TaxID=979761 RepID=A0A9P6FND2_9FUNG|nr:hypothetical protein BGW38_006726 [Lunasporangiospora selenospora]
MELPPSPANSIPFIITTSAEEDKSEKRVPVNGASPIRSLQACSKLDMEPNPFEQSFSKTGAIGSSESSSSNGEQSTVETPKTVLPPIASMSGRLAPGTDQFNWDTQSLRMGPLSPSMLEGPQNPIVFDDDIAANPAPISSFPSSSAPPISSIFNPAVPIQDNSMTMVGISGTQQPIPSLPPPPLHAGPAPTDPFQPSVFNQSSSMVQSQQQQPSQGQQPPAQQQSSYSQGGSGPRPNQPLSHPNAQPYVNDRYGPPPPPQSGAHGDNYGNLHLLSQATREAWIKRESVDTNGHLSHSQAQSQHPHHSQQQQQQPMPQHHPHGSSGPIKAGQSLPGMPGMVAAPQLPKNGVEPAFVRGVRRTKITSDDNSDDSDKHSSNSDNMTDKGDGYSGMNGTGAGANGTNSKKRGAEDRPMDEDEKRKNFLERNRQAALKCRQRKKQWLANLQTKVEYLSNDNEQLQAQTAALRDEIIHLKALLLAHKDCPVAQANGVYAETIGVMGHGRAGGPPMHQGPPGRGGPPGPPRGSLPPPPHGHMPQGGLPHPHGRMMPGSMHPGAGPNGIPGSGVGNRPMSMMQDITPNASPSQTQATLRY